jgi:hypothetical protein
MQQGEQPKFELPARLRLPQVPPLKVPARRQTQFIIPPSPARYTEQIPVTPPPIATRDFIVRVPVTPPITSLQQAWVRTPYPANLSIPGTPMKEFVPTSKRARNTSNGEVLLGCVCLIVAGLVALGLLIWLSSAM